MAERVTLQFPDGAFSPLRRSPAEFAEEVKRAAVCKWYELGVVSQSKAAELLGISRVRLMELLAAYRVSPIQATAEELGGELDGERMSVWRPEATELHNRTE
jgi:predicted HTH domain antitoxin